MAGRIRKPGERRSPRGRLATAALSVAVAGSLALANSPAAGEPVFEEATAGVALAQDPAEVRSYWTRERMRTARPAEELLAELGVGSAGPADAAVPPRSSAAGGTMNRKRVKRLRRFPKRTHGKVYFRLGGGNYVCSGTVVHAPNRSLVLTAGHCVVEPGALGSSRWATNWQFVPALKDGRRPFGEWPAVSVHAPTQWSESGGTIGLNDDLRYDVGAAVLAKRNGEGIEDVVGARRPAFNRTRDRVYRAFGYPAESPPPEFDGRHMFRCRSPYRGDDRSFGSPRPLRIDCDMTAGSSGGGWVIRGGRVASVVSYGYGNQPQLYGPYFGSVIKNFYASVKSS